MADQADLRHAIAPIGRQARQRVRSVRCCRAEQAGAVAEAVRLTVELGGLQQTDIAAALEVTRSTVGRWHNGETYPAPQHYRIYVARLAELLAD